MARGVVSNIESQLRSSRERLHGGTIEGASYDSFERLQRLRTSLDGVGESGDPELLRHFPVAAVAVLESHFKSRVALIVDSGVIYLERGLQLAKDRLKGASEIVPLLHRNAATVGELVAHVLPFNSVASIENAFTVLLGEDFKRLIACVKDPYRTRNQLADTFPIVQNIDQLWHDLSAAFEQRHILAHEAATKYAISFHQAGVAVASCALFSEALDALMWDTVWREEPLTQYEMNVCAWSKCFQARKALAASLRSGLRIATQGGQRGRFRQLNFELKQATQKWERWMSEVGAMGSIQPMLRAEAQEKATRNRLSLIDGWVESFGLLTDFGRT